MVKPLILANLLLLGCRLNINTPDRIWEHIERHNPSLYRLDNTDSKSWVAHACFSIGGGYLLSKTTPMNFNTGMRTMVGFYFIRETYNICCDGNRKYFDATMDVVVPLATIETIIRVRKH